MADALLVRCEECGEALDLVADLREHPDSSLVSTSSKVWASVGIIFAIWRNNS